MTNAFQWERLADGLRLCVSRAHRFGTDAFLLSDFAAPRRRDRVCDLCTGCGIVAVLWFRDPAEAPAQVFAVEIQPEAAQLVRRTAAEGGFPEGRLVPIEGDLRAWGSMPIEPGSLDLVTCNPPYKQQGRGILSAADSERIARHETSCTLEDLCACAARLLRFGGRLCICQRPERLADAMGAMRAHGLEPKRLRFVQKNPESAPWLFLLEGKRGARPFMQVEPPLYVQGAGGFSPELLRIYQKKTNKMKGAEL